MRVFRILAAIIFSVALYSCSSEEESTTSKPAEQGAQIEVKPTPVPIWVTDEMLKLDAPLVMTNAAGKHYPLTLETVVKQTEVSDDGQKIVYDRMHISKAVKVPVAQQEGLYILILNTSNFRVGIKKVIPTDLGFVTFVERRAVDGKTIVRSRGKSFPKKSLSFEAIHGATLVKFNMVLPKGYYLLTFPNPNGDRALIKIE